MSSWQTFNARFKPANSRIQTRNCAISGFRCGMNDVFPLLGCYAALFVVSYRRFGTAYRSHLQGSSKQSAWPLKMGPTGCPETSVANYQSTLRRQMSEERRTALVTASHRWPIRRRKTIQYPVKYVIHALRFILHVQGFGVFLQNIYTTLRI